MGYFDPPDGYEPCEVHQERAEVRLYEDGCPNCEPQENGEGWPFLPQPEKSSDDLICSHCGKTESVWDKAIEMFYDGCFTSEPDDD